MVGQKLRAEVVIVAGLTALAAAVRFATLDLQAFGEDEAVTAGAVLDSNFVQMLREVAGGESTPPLYYVMAWPWSKVFGIGEVGLRTLSALIGTAVVPVAYALGAKLASRRIGVVLAALVAVNPMLVWYSQEARAYSLLVLTSMASLLLFAYALEAPTRRRLAAWAVISFLTLATHYFGVFLVAAEAIWLLVAWRQQRDVWWTVGGVIAAGLALVPLAIYQADSNRTDWIAQSPLGGRLQGTAEEFLVGPTGMQLAHVVAIAATLVGVALVLLIWRAKGRERYGAFVAAVLGVTVVLVPLALILADADRVLARNLLPALVPLALVVAAGLGAKRSGLLGLAATAGLCAVSLVVVTQVAKSAELQRDDYRGAAELIRAGPSAAVVARVNAGHALRFYLGEDRPWDDPPVDELVVVGAWDPAHVSESFKGFEPTEPHELAGFLRVTRLHSSRPRRVEQPALTRLDPGGATLILYEAPPG
jgi:hypothetical protein